MQKKFDPIVHTILTRLLVQYTLVLLMNFRFTYYTEEEKTRQNHGNMPYAKKKVNFLMFFW